jgi:DNA repair protein SbcD/Mre11
MRILHAADIHLDSPLSGLAARAGARADELVGATRRAFWGLIDYAIEAEIALVLIAGDLYDGDWKDFSTGLFFMDAMARLERAGIRVALIKGNHDAENLMTRSLRHPPNVKVFRADRPETWKLDDLGIAIHGQSFPRRDVTDNIALAYPEAQPGFLNIGLLHTAADGKLGQQHAPYAPCSVAELAAKGYDYWALGHVHTRAVLSEAPWIVFPGNLQGRHANEAGAKGATLLTVEDREIRSVEPVILDVVRWARITIDLTGCGDYDEACGRIRDGISRAAGQADGRTLASRLTLTGKTSIHGALAGDSERTTAECLALAAQAGGDVWLERVVIETMEPGGAAPGGDALAELLAVVDNIRADPDQMAEIRAELAQALTRMPIKVRDLAGLKELDDTVLGPVLDGAAAILRHRLIDPHQGDA